MNRVSLAIFFAIFSVAAGGCGSSSNPPGTHVDDAGMIVPNVDGAVGPEIDSEVPAAVRAPELGTGDHTAASVTFTEIAAAAARPSQPRDLAFNPMRPDELWVINHDDDSVVIVHDASTDGRRAEYRKDGYALHFMAEPSSIAFGADATTIGLPGTFATCGESRNHYDNMAAPNDFMGPALWSSDLTIFARMNPNRLGSHLDMLHHSPNCMGIAHETANVYWVFDGMHGAIVRYDFGRDDGVGNDNHSDGRVRRYASGQVRRVPAVPSHLVFDPDHSALYVADSGNGRVIALDTSSGTPGVSLENFERIAEHRQMDNAVVRDIVAPGVLMAPSGIALRNGLLYVSDNRSARISAFTLEGEEVNHLDTDLGPGALGGLTFGPDDKLYLVDMLNDRVLRIDPIAP